MKSQFEKYAKLQQTIWPKYATTTLGNLPADKASIIDAEYDKVIDMEAKGVVPAITEPTEKIEKGEAVNVSVETEMPSDNVDPVGDQGPVDATVSETTGEMADTETGFDDEVKAGE